GIHLIFGLGDTEREFTQTIDWVYAHHGKVGLFALTPVRGAQTSLQPPDLAAWRRMQIFRYLRSLKMLEYKSCRFENDCLSRVPLAADEYERCLADGEAFRTAGCPDCNRPYYNERPGGILYNFPRQLASDEVRQCLAEAGGLTDACNGERNCP
ncbi:MAG TPA: radical SAM protein, partial [Candidatus Ozemobacteraceae bacterium]|nr:radical SAM protein [Candidatus Ozemobacteraceae bacterium]